MPTTIRTVLLAAAVVFTVPFTGASFAQQPTAESAATRFNIERFEVNGNTLVPGPDLDRAVAPFIGAGKDFGDVQRALDAIEQKYRELGYGSVQVLLPEQDITKGVVQFRVIEPRVGRVVVEGNQHFDVDNVRHSTPSIREGQTPNSAEMSRNLQVLAEHPTKQTSITLRPGTSEDLVDVGVKVTDEKPLRYFFTLDNTGTGETGYFRLGAGFQHSNLFNKDHVLTAQYITSPTQPDDVKIFGLGYRIPFYELNSTLDLVVGYSDVNSGTVQGLFNVAGSGTIALARWNYFLPRVGQFEHKISAGLDYRAFQNQVTLNGQGVVPDITIKPASLTYSGLRRYSDAELSFYASASANVFPDGVDGDQEAFTRTRLGATANYKVFRYGANYVQSLPSDWQFRAALNAQYTSDLLVPGEQFGIGGPDSVRGYILRELSSDKGYQTQVELYTPDLSRKLDMPDTYKLRFLAFYDFGSLERNNPLPGEAEHDSIYSLGIGARLNYKKLVTLRLDAAQIMQPTAARQNDSVRVTGSLAVVF